MSFPSVRSARPADRAAGGIRARALELAPAGHPQRAFRATVPLPAVVVWRTTPKAWPMRHEPAASVQEERRPGGSADPGGDSSLVAKPSRDDTILRTTLRGPRSAPQAEPRARATLRERRPRTKFSPQM